MTKEQNERLYDALNAVYKSKEMQDLVNLVMELRDSEECVQGSCYNIYPHVERAIDDIATRAGWIYDQLQGVPKRGLSKYQKIRKALGYTYP
jgi:hypothetical protein